MVLKKMPENAAYRMNTEAIVRNRYDIVKNVSTLLYVFDIISLYCVGLLLATNIGKYGLLVYLAWNKNWLFDSSERLVLFKWSYSYPTISFKEFKLESIYRLTLKKKTCNQYIQAYFIVQKIHLTWQKKHNTQLFFLSINYIDPVTQRSVQ